MSLIRQAAEIRAALLNLSLPETVISKQLEWSVSRDQPGLPRGYQLPVAENRELWMTIFKDIIEGLVWDEGDTIGWGADQFVSAGILAAKESLLRCIPHILPVGDEFYRLVLEHPHFDLCNMSKFLDDDDKVKITSVYSWSHACIIPLLLHEVKTHVNAFDLTMDEDGNPRVIALPEERQMGKYKGRPWWEGFLLAVTPRWITDYQRRQEHQELWGYFLKVSIPLHCNNFLVRCSPLYHSISPIL